MWITTEAGDNTVKTVVPRWQRRTLDTGRGAESNDRQTTGALIRILLSMTTLRPTPVTRQPLTAPRRIVTGLVSGWTALTIVYAVASALDAAQRPLFLVPADADRYSPGPGFVDLALVLWWLSFLLLPTAIVLALMMRRWPRCPSLPNRVAAIGTILAGGIAAGLVNHAAEAQLTADVAAGLLCVIGLATPAGVFWLLRPTRTSTS